MRVLSLACKAHHAYVSSCMLSFVQALICRLWSCMKGKFSLVETGMHGIGASPNFSAACS